MPDWAREVRERLSSLRLPPAREAEIVDELSQHLDDRYGELIAAGMSPEDAARAALRLFQSGNVLSKQMASLQQSHAAPPLTRAHQPDTRSAISGRTCATPRARSGSSPGLLQRRC